MRDRVEEEKDEFVEVVQFRVCFIVAYACSIVYSLADIAFSNRWKV